jgi:hypothetical protein
MREKWKRKTFSSSNSFLFKEKRKKSTHLIRELNEIIIIVRWQAGIK